MGCGLMMSMEQRSVIQNTSSVIPTVNMALSLCTVRVNIPTDRRENMIEVNDARCRDS